MQQQSCLSGNVRLNYPLLDGCPRMSDKLEVVLYEREINLSCSKSLLLFSLIGYVGITSYSDEKKQIQAYSSVFQCQ